MRVLLPLALLISSSCGYAQSNEAAKATTAQPQLTTQASADLPDAPGTPLQETSSSASAAAADQASRKAAERTDQTNQVPLSAQQPKRILGLMPNYRAVSAGAVPPPPTPKEAFKIATQNSFDYSSFVFTGLTSLIAEGNDSHPQLGKGVPGFWAYSWRGFLDKTDGNYWVIFALPTVFHEDERYYALGTGSIWKRTLYSTSRVLITPDYHGHNTINASELLGRGIAQAISITYYPSQDRTGSDIASKYAYALMRDAATNAFREFWPDIAVHVLHRHP